MTAVQGSHVVLDCQAQGEPPIAIRWLKNRQRVLESERVGLLANGSLVISRVMGGREAISDEGFYHCLASNTYGAILTHRAQLSIASK